MWYIIVTVNVVGFGDFFPETYLGRGISVVAVIIGDILIALMVVSLTFTSEFSP
jgi:voltage-gated potassium channel